MAKEQDRLKGRNGNIYRDWVMGMTQMAIAEKYGIAQTTVSDAIRNVRDSIPNEERRDLINDMVDYLRGLRVTVMDIAALPAAPVTAGQHGEVVHDPETGTVVRDYSTRLNAIRTAIAVADKEIDLLGLKAEQKVRINEGEEQASRKAAADALAHLHGGTDE